MEIFDDISTILNYIEPEVTMCWDPLEDDSSYSSRTDESAIDIADFVATAETYLQRYGIDDNASDVGEISVVGMEVGDDRVDLSNSAKILACMLVIQEKIFKMKTSWKDTYISKSDWNFCEVTSSIPRAVEESMDYARKSGKLNLLGFTDAPVLRTVIDVAKSDRSHSSSHTGKESMLGRRVSTPRTSNAPVMQLASWLQDGFLNTSRSESPKYMPYLAAGSGCPPLWGNPDNTYLFMRTYKHGKYARVYGSAINEMQACVRGLDRGESIDAILCKRLRDRDWHLHITYGANVIIPEKQSYLREKLPEPVYLASGTSVGIRSTESRLMRARILLTRRDAEIEIDRTCRISNALFGVDSLPELERTRRREQHEIASKYSGAIRSNAAVLALLEKKGSPSDEQALLEQGFTYSSSGVHDMSRELVQWICEGGRGEAFDIFDIPFSEDMFFRDEISIEETLRVPGVPLDIPLNLRPSIKRMTEARIGLWQISASQEEWAETLASSLRLARIENGGRPLVYQEVSQIFLKYPEWVNDDSLIISDALSRGKDSSTQALVLISSDVKLGRNLSETAQSWVYLVHPPDVISLLGGVFSVDRVISLEDLEPLLHSLKGRYPAPIRVYTDTGSLQAYAQRVVPGTNPLGDDNGTLWGKRVISIETIGGHRTTEVELTKIDRLKRTTVRVFAPNRAETVSHGVKTSEKPERVGLLKKATRLLRRKGG